MGLAVNTANFDHGGFGWLGDLETGDVDWDGLGDDEPTEEDVEAAQAHWEDWEWSIALDGEADSRNEN